MHYLFQFDIAAIALTTLLLVIYILGKSYPTRTRSILICLMAVTIVAATFDLISHFTIGSTVPDAVNYLVKGGFIVTNNFCALIYYSYVISLANAGKKYRVINYVLMGLVVLLTGTTHLTHWIFRIENGAYIRERFYLSLYVVTFVALALSVLILIRHREAMTRFQIASVASFLLVVVAAIAIQFFYEAARLSSFSCSLGLVLIYASLERPSDFLYKKTDCYNRLAFEEYIKNHRDGHFQILIAHPTNADYLNSALSADAWDMMVFFLIRELHDIFGQKSVFLMDGASFAILTPEGDVEKTVRKFETSVPNTFRAGDVELSLSFGFSAISYSTFAGKPDKLRETVDFVLHSGEKTAEKVTWVSLSDSEKLDRAILVLNAVREALREKRFQVYYQPIRDAKTGRFSSAEALIRLQDPALGFISPDEFIPIAEQNGLIVPIGEFVFETVCDFWRRNNLSDLGVQFIEVNLSTLQCMQRDLPARMLRIMKRHGMDSRFINFEITETAAASDHSVMLGNMTALVGSGTAFSLDDYGTGYSNISYLASLPINIVKIDKSILWKAMDDPDGRTILRHTLQMVHDLGKKTVVEGVENEKMVRLLEEIGADYYQGFLFSRPIPEQEFLAFLRRQ